jgi:hypothetical protein
MDFLDSCKIEYNNSKHFFTQENASLFFTHFGEFTSSNISELTSKAENYLKEIGAAKKSIKNTFNVLIEGLQNMINHGEISSSGKQIAFFNIGEKDNYYIMNFSNLIMNINIDMIKKSIDKLNSSDQAGVKNIYLETLTNGEISEKGGAGLGIITMAMKSKNKIEYKFLSLNDSLSIITIEVKINKN